MKRHTQQNKARAITATADITVLAVNITSMTVLFAYFIFKLC